MTLVTAFTGRADNSTCGSENITCRQWNSNCAVRIPQLLADFLDTSPVGVFAIDREGSIAYVNPKQCENSNLRRDELVGQNYRAFFTTRCNGIASSISLIASTKQGSPLRSPLRTTAEAQHIESAHEYREVKQPLLGEEEQEDPHDGKRRQHG